MKILLPLLFVGLFVAGSISLGSSADKNKEKNSNIVYLTKSDDLNRVIRTEKKVLVDFYADWCGPCVKLAPELEALSKTDAELKIVKVNVDKAPELSRRFGIRGIPALFVFTDGKQTKSSTGYHSQEQLKALFSGGSDVVKNQKSSCCPH